MLQITNKATDHLLRVRREKGHDANAVPRFVRRSGRLALTWVREPESGDRVVDGERVRTVIAPSASDLLEDKTIDIKVTPDERPVLIVRSPKTNGKDAAAPTTMRRRRAAATS